MEKKDTLTVSTESAFHALGLPDADDLVLRAELLSRIGDIIKDRGLSQAHVGKLIAMDQPRVSALLHRKITKFSTDRLLRALSDLGQNVEVRISPAKTAKGKLHVAA